ncbi:hypothetical protein [Legionella sp. W05-934-2]|uniref:hypothetical protein n=1 Tax=Legionella sp. W05-934-2 TaxID=1198649 RepID=UPI003461862C
MVNTFRFWLEKSEDNRRNNFSKIKQWDLRTPTFLSTKVINWLLPHEGDAINNLGKIATAGFRYEPINLVDDNLTLHHFFPENTHNGYFIIHFPGNKQNTLDAQYINKCLNESPHSAHYFWNYPQIGSIKNSTYTAHDRQIAGTRLIQYLINSEHLPADKLIVDAWSMGSGVALNATRNLYEQGHAIGLLMDRGFTGTNSVFQEKAKQLQSTKWITFASSCVYFATYASLPGLILSRMLASVGVLLNVGIVGFGNGLGAVLDYCGDMLGKIHPLAHALFTIPFKATASFVRGIFSFMGILLDNIVNLVASLAGGMMILLGIMNGLFLGSAIGAIATLWQIATKKPILFNTEKPLSYLFKWTDFELNTDEDLTNLVNSQAFKAHPNNVISINTTDDWLVEAGASLNTSIEKLTPKTHNIKKIWFNKGSHGDELAEPVGEENANETHETLLNKLIP